MLSVLSPAKSLDYESRLPTRKHTQPRLLDEAARLIEVMRTKSVADLASLMHISDELAALNAQRYAEFSIPFTTKNARPALLAFAGDVYQGMAAAERFDERDYTESQKSVRILSGLYGLLRPLDLMQPYRLEMGTRLRTERGDSLYDWWGDIVSRLVRSDLEASPGAEVLVNLASAEYAKVLRPEVIGMPVVEPRFEDTDETGKTKVMAFFAKRARGEMAAWLVQNRIRRVNQLREFEGAGYHFERRASTAERPVFVRAYADRR